MVGAWLLREVVSLPPISQYQFAGRTAVVSPVKLIVAVLMMIFAVLELIPRYKEWQVSPRYISIGGFLSGFFGGLSGHQGALRAAFLVRAGLTKEAFIGTTAVCSVVVDVSRLLVYGVTFFAADFMVLHRQGGTGLVAIGALSAFAGSFLATRLVKKVTFRAIRYAVAAMLFVIAIGLGSGMLGSR